MRGTSPTRRVSSANGCTPLAIAPQRSCRRSRLQNASDSRAASTSTTTSFPAAVPNEPRRARTPQHGEEAPAGCVLLFKNPPPSQPLFLWVHYYDPHYPYTPPEPF